MASKLIIPFQFDLYTVRGIADDKGDPWFVLGDLLNATESKTAVNNAAKSIREELGDEVVTEILIPDSLGREQLTVIVHEAGATFWIARSRTKIGKRLNRFIHFDVLPSIRKTGQYRLIQSHYLRLDGPADFERLVSERLVKLACQMYSRPYDPERMPPFLLGFVGTYIYSRFPEAVRDYTRENRRPWVKDHQHFNGETRRKVLELINKLEGMLIAPARLRDPELFKEMYREEFGEPGQLGLLIVPH